MKRALLFSVLIAASLVMRAQSVPSLLVPGDASGTIAPTVLFNADKAFENNPAAAAFAPKRIGAWGGFAVWAPATAGTSIYGGGASMRFGDKFAAALSYKSLSDRPYEIVSVSGSVTGTFTPKDNIISMGAAYRVLPELSAGLMLHYVTSEIGVDMKGSAICADLSVYYTKEALTAGASVRNLGGKINWGGDSYALPLTASAGAAYSIAGLKAGLELSYLFEGAFGAGLGAEYTVMDIATIRAGYHLGDKAKGLASFASLGLGAGFAGVSLDVAYLLASDTLGGSLMLSLGYSF